MHVYGVNWAKAFNAGAMRRALEKGSENLAMSKNNVHNYTSRNLYPAKAGKLKSFSRPDVFAPHLPAIVPLCGTQARRASME